jgi:hypothetical protein
MWRERQELVRALFAICGLLACFTVVVASWPDRVRTRLAVTTPAPVVVRAPISDGALIIPAAAHTGSITTAK